MEELEIRGYTDPRTGEYKRATEANRDEVLEDMGFLYAWKFYWDGPLTKDLQTGSETPLYSRAAWLNSPEREGWLDHLSEEQRAMLADAPPPEEVPALAPVQDDA